MSITPLGRLWGSVARVFVDRPQTPTSAETLVPVIARLPLRQGMVPYQTTGRGIVPPMFMDPWFNQAPAPLAQPNQQTTGMAWGTTAQASWSIPIQTAVPNVKVL